MMSSIKPKHRFLFKATWRGTALRFHVEAKNEEEAKVKAAKQVLKMEGGISCMAVEFIREVE